MSNSDVMSSLGEIMRKFIKIRSVSKDIHRVNIEQLVDFEDHLDKFKLEFSDGQHLFVFVKDFPQELKEVIYG